MTTRLTQMPWLEWQQTQTVLKAFAQVSAPVRFVGGCVRDTLLGLTVEDVDLATPLPPEHVRDLLIANGIKAIPTGLEHGTITAIVDKKQFEITTLRRDVKTDGRHATVEFTDDWKEDAKRRDFTMNALYADPDGTLTDYFGGVRDALAGQVRFIGDAQQRIEEDALRILRFFRFNARFSPFPLDTSGHAACTKNSGLIDRLSGERIQNEMWKLLAAPYAGQMLRVMAENSVLSYLVPSLVDVDYLQGLIAREVLLNLPADPLLRLAALLRGTTDPAAICRAIAARWKLSQADQKHLSARIVPIPFTLDSDEATQKKYIRTLGVSVFCDLCLLLPDADTKQITDRIERARNWEIPVFPVTGDDLLEKGIKAGPALGRELKRLEALWEDSGYTLTRDALLKAL